MNFDNLISTITQTSQLFQFKAVLAVNQSLTLRNWCIGSHLFEFEQKGEDRARYGDRLLGKISLSLKEKGLKGFSTTNLKLFRQFYTSYPHIGQATTDLFQQEYPGFILPLHSQVVSIGQPVTDQLGISANRLIEHHNMLLTRLSFTHIVELIQLDDPLKRLFYEVECMNGNWSVKELKRQIGSLLFERTGLSRDKDALLRLVNEQANTLVPHHIIRDPYVFEFLGLTSHEVLSEKGLEYAMLDNLQRFLLEMGKGFCFEARQKRITVANEHYFIDLVFYHRILKCHVLIELKAEKFKHPHVGQLNYYLNYFKKYEMTEWDNPPVGILLCTAKDAEHVEFATAGLDNQVFVSKYKLVLPSLDELKQFIQKELEKGA